MAAAPRTIVLCPFLTHIEPACERGLREVEAAGLEVRRFAASAAIDRTRGDAATAALADGAEALLWIDSDVAFTAAEVAALCAHRLPVVAGLYPKKGVRDFAVHLEPGTTELGVGTSGGLYDVRYVGAGFLYTEREVYDDVRRHFGLPTCNTRFGAPTVPYFLPMVVADPAGPPGAYWYLGEDYAFCERARQAGHKIVVDTTLRLGHVGKYTYGWEDAGQQVARVTGARFQYGPGGVVGDE
ncbi:MAG: hypothetical protein IPL61_05300 [Myxococcales bacterium]|nr:hypothetical protein [Myxococcales bacterium]